MSIKNLFEEKRVRNISITLTLLLILVLVMYFGFNRTVNASSDEGLIVQGVLETEEININSKVPGRVVKVYVEEGQKVKQGDPLLEISSDELKAKKQQAEAAVAQAEAGLKAAKELHEQAKAGVEAAKGLVEQAKAGITASELKVNEAKAGITASEKQYEAALAMKQKADKGAREQEIAKAQTAYDLMKASYDRIVVLEQKGAVSKQKLDEVQAQLKVAEETLSMAKEGATAEDKLAATATSEQAEAGVEASKTRVDQAEAGLVAARAQLTQAMAGVDSSNALLLQAQAGVEAKEGLVQQAKGALAEVEAYLNEIIIKAPIDGTITTLNSKEGELVSTGTQIGIVSNLKDTWVQVSIKETDLSKIKEGKSVLVKVPAYKDQTFTGKITTINAQPSFAVKRATNENGDFDIVSFGVKVQIENPNETLRPGMSANLQFIEEE